MKVVRLLALHTGRLCPTWNIPGTHFSSWLSRPLYHCVAGKFMSLSWFEPATFRLLAQCLNPLGDHTHTHTHTHIHRLFYFITWLV